MTSNNINPSGTHVRPKPARGNLNQVAFLAVLDDVRAQLIAGHATKSVWRTLREVERIKMSYEAFLHYVQRLGVHPQTGQTSASTSIRADNHADAASASPKAPTAPGTIPGFTFNPTPDIEELF